MSIMANMTRNDPKISTKFMFIGVVLYLGVCVGFVPRNTSAIEYAKIGFFH